MNYKELQEGEQMKKHIVSVDINRLDTEDLKRLAKMLYEEGKMESVKEINDRIAFQEGWMNKKQAEEYAEKYC